MFQKFSTYICWKKYIKWGVWRVAVCPSYIQDARFNKWFEKSSQLSAPCRVQLKCDGTRWRTGGEVNGKLVNGVGSQYPSLPRNMVYPASLPLMRTLRLQIVDWTDAPADLNGLVRLGERRNVVYARVPSGSAGALLPLYAFIVWKGTVLLKVLSLLGNLDSTMALGPTQPLIEMSTRCISWG